MRRVLVVLVSVLFIGLVAPTAVAQTSEPAPPVNLVATPTEGGMLLTWDSPVDDGGSPITSYYVYAVNGTAKVLLGEASVEEFLDESGGDYLGYFVTANNAAGESLPSNPALNWPRCTWLGVAFDLTPPFFHGYEIHPDCLFPLPFILSILEG